MSKRKWIIGGFAVLIFIVTLVYFFFPSDELPASKIEKEKKVSFLEVDSQWADSLLKTMSNEEKAAMLILYKPNSKLSGDSAFLSNPIPGGYVLSANQLDETYSKDITRSLLFASFDQIPVANKKIKAKWYNEGKKSPIVSNAEMILSVTKDTVLNEVSQNLKLAADYFHLDGIFFPQLGFHAEKSKWYPLFKKDTSFYLSFLEKFQSEFNEEHFLTGSGIINSSEVKENDSVWVALKNYAKEKFPLFYIDSLFKTKKSDPESITGFLKSELNFEGLCIALLQSKEKNNADKISKLINSGADMIQTPHFTDVYLSLLKEINSGAIHKNTLNARVRKILLAKTWSKMRKNRLSYTQPKEFNTYQRTTHVRLSKASFVLLRNAKNHIPIRNITNNRMAIIHFGKSPENFVSQFYHYLPPEQIVPVKLFKEINNSAVFNPGDYKKYQTTVVTIDDDIHLNQQLIEKLQVLNSNTKLIIINFSHPKNISALANFPTLIQVWNNSIVESRFVAQSVFGAVEFSGRIPIYFDKKLKLDKSQKLTQSRLQYTFPEELGIASDSLLKIDYIVEEGIRNRAFPGAQVFFALEGKVFYNKSFGTHVYNDKQEVKTGDLFDMASVTKVAASTIVAMSTYEKGMYKLNDSLWKHLPDTLKKHLRAPSTLRNITFKQILTHETGLAAGQPIIRYLNYRDTLDSKIGRFDRYYCDESDKYYCVQVADKFFMEREQLDTIWYAMNRMKPDENPDYRYSDANMNLLYKLLDSKIKNRWRFYLDSLFYKPLGMFNTCYLPIQNEIKPERIVPTENDRYWRKQLLRGYVHDPTAALFGGVAGNAGLFSTAEDIGKLFQMLLYDGNYGGVSYFKKETVELFTSQQSGSHRGLGFNRQVKGNTYGCSPYASNNTFGHTGFTGISVWADKEIGLIYVSCTNRVHPDPDNKKIINLGTTKRIHNVVYEQLKYVMPDKINLEY